MTTLAEVQAENDALRAELAAAKAPRTATTVILAAKHISVGEESSRGYTISANPKLEIAFGPSGSALDAKAVKHVSLRVDFLRLMMANPVVREAMGIVA